MVSCRNLQNKKSITVFVKAWMKYSVDCNSLDYNAVAENSVAGSCLVNANMKGEKTVVKEHFC